MQEPTQNIVHELARTIASLQSCQAHGTRLMQLEAEVKRAEQEFAGLQAQIAQAEPLAKQIDELDQIIRRKRSELAELDAVIAKKHEQHGSIDGELNTIIKKASRLVQRPV